MEDNISLDLNESIRLRPGMYIGRVHNQGFIFLLRNIFSASLFWSAPSSFRIYLSENAAAKLVFENIKNPIRDILRLLLNSLS